MSAGIEFVYHDGGRQFAGYKGTAGDCATRAAAIATGAPYQMIYDQINEIARRHERRGKVKRGISNARTGVYPENMKRLMRLYGFLWVPTMGIGTGCQVHLRAGELPSGHLVVSLSKHYSAVIDGVLYDTGDVSREGTRCVYGYWIEPSNDHDSISSIST